MLSIKMLARIKSWLSTRIAAKQVAVAELATANSQKAAKAAKAAAKLRVEIAQLTYEFETKQMKKITEIQAKAIEDKAKLEALLK